MRALVIGDIMLDIYREGEISRISPEAPVPVILNPQDTYAAGGAANVAVNLASMGTSTILAGIIGNDYEGQQLIKITESAHVLTHYICAEALPTISKTRIIANGKHVTRLDREFPYSQYAHQLTDLVQKIEAELVIISDYNKGSLADIPGLISSFNQKGTKVLVDPKRDFSFYEGAWLIKPNRIEFEKFVGTFSDFNELVEKGRNALLKYNIRHMVVTLGSKGIMYIHSDDHQYYPAKAENVYDITGAGDTVISAIVHMLTQNKSLTEAITCARDMSGIAVSNFGTYVITAKDLSTYTL